MATGIEFKIDLNLEQLIKKVEDPQLVGRPLRRMLVKTGGVVEGNVKKLTPVDQGQSRASITNAVDGSPLPRWVRVFSNLKTINYLERGTAPHWPPVDAINAWAGRHGFPAGRGFLVARAIAQRGTIKRYFGKFGQGARGPAGARMFRRGLEASKDAIHRFTLDMAKEIKQGFRR